MHNWACFGHACVVDGSAEVRVCVTYVHTSELGPCVFWFCARVLWVVEALWVLEALWQHHVHRRDCSHHRLHLRVGFSGVCVHWYPTLSNMVGHGLQSRAGLLLTVTVTVTWSRTSRNTP